MTPTASRARAWLRGGALVTGLAAAGGAAVAVVSGESLDVRQTQKAIDRAYTTFKDLRQGKNGQDAPGLAKADPTLFGIALVTTDGRLITAGDARAEVSLQSIAHVFTLAHVLDESGATAMPDAVRAGADPDPVALSRLVRGATAGDRWDAVIGTYSAFAGRRLAIDPQLHRPKPVLDGDDAAIDLALRESAVAVSAIDLATMAATLANGGVNPRTGVTALASRHVAAVLAVMAMGGLSDGSGQWLYQTGLPAKSGAAGGLLAVCPGRFGIAAVSPPLDEAGNSVRAQKAIASVADALQANPYAARPLSAQR